MNSIWLYRLVRFGLAAVFIWSGAAKLLDPGSFARVISAYGLVWDVFVWPLALGLPLLELLAGIGLFFDVRFSLSAITGMLMLFAGVLWFGLLGDLDVDCGCFSASERAEHHGLRAALYRDLAFIGLALYLYWWRFMRFRSTRAIGLKQDVPERYPA